MSQHLLLVLTHEIVPKIENSTQNWSLIQKTVDVKLYTFCLFRGPVISKHVKLHPLIFLIIIIEVFKSKKE